MLASIQKFFEHHISPPESRDLSVEQRRLACAALLIEVATIDQHFDERELAAMQGILREKFHISGEECTALTNLAKSESGAASSTYQFTRLINDHFSAEEKFELIKNMWTIAWADGEIDKYEEYTIRMVSELIYVSHSEFIRAKIIARDNAGAN